MGGASYTENKLLARNKREWGDPSSRVISM